MIIEGKLKDLGGGFTVSRYVPNTQCHSVGPFIFLDQMGPVDVSSNSKLDVRPHPHIGLATVTYLFAGEGLHRDSLGSVQVIRPGDINYMTAGRGIAHSERTPEAFLSETNLERKIHGLQFWVALPNEQEECEPSFVHYSKQQLPITQIDQNIRCKVLIGDAHALQSPVKTRFRTLFMWWNFVSTHRERIRTAADQWKSGQFSKVPGETDFIPLPNDPLP